MDISKLTRADYLMAGSSVVAVCLLAALHWVVLPLAACGGIFFFGYTLSKIEPTDGTD